MKKTLLCSALLAGLSGVAAAQSSVTMYGVFDAGVYVQKNQGQSATVQMDSGNWMGSRWGIKGKEDLGNGYSVGFVLEQGFESDSGADKGKAFHRQSTLSVSGPFGEVAFGRMGGLSSDCGSYSILGGSAYTTSFMAIGDVYSAFALSDRMNNSVVYVSPEFGGFTATAMYSNGIEDDAAKWSKNGHYYGLGGVYSNGALKFDVIYEALDNRTDNGKSDTTQLINLGASYDFGSFTLYGAYEYAIHSAMPNGAVPDGFKDEGKGANFNAFSLSVSAPLCGGTAMLQTQYAFGKVKDAKKDPATDDKFSTFSVGAAYLYPLSKRTLIYTSTGYGTAWKAARHLTKDSDSYRGWNFGLGMTHQF